MENKNIVTCKYCNQEFDWESCKTYCCEKCGTDFCIDCLEAKTKKSISLYDNILCLDCLDG